MWKWIKRLFRPKRQVYPTIDSVKPLTKGDLKKLAAHGKIEKKDIYGQK